MIELTCKHCEDTFEEYPSKSDKNFCSRDCWSNSSRIEKSCKNCGEKFWTYQSDDKVYCSESCHRSHKRKEVVEVTCEHCGDSFDKSLSQIARYPRHFCSKSCSASSQTGSDNPNWAGGDEIYDLYGAGWKESRENAMERDGHSCAICNASDKRLEVHHITSRRELYDEESESFKEGVNDLENLVVLCSDHHAPLEGEFTTASYDEFIERSKDLLQSQFNSKS